MDADVVFVCPHGAGRSRIAAAWFGVLAPTGWAATSAGPHPQATVSPHAPRLLAGAPALAFPDTGLPRPLSTVPDPPVTVAIDCPDGAVGADVSWSLDHGDAGAAVESDDHELLRCARFVYDALHAYCQGALS